MGFDKQLLTLNHTRLFERNYRILKNYFSEIMVSTYTPELYKDYDVVCVEDVFPHLGPLSGIHAGLSAATSDYVYVLACDMPVILPPYIQFMQLNIYTSSTAPDACVTQNDGWFEPFNAFYGKTALPQITADLSEEKSSVQYLLREIRAMEIQKKEALRFCPDWTMFLNLNSRELYETYAANFHILHPGE